MDGGASMFTDESGVSQMVDSRSVSDGVFYTEGAHQLCAERSSRESREAQAFFFQAGQALFKGWSRWKPALEPFADPWQF